MRSIGIDLARYGLLLRESFCYRSPMQGCCRPFQIERMVPLTISRGQTRCLERLLVEVSHEGITGLGETGQVDTGHHHYSSEAVAAELAQLWPPSGALCSRPVATV